ncbi:hypothetical protein ACIBLB_12025 [Streptosporangium canum]|uniref:hypothetical protein n=1 Tax=Streptosporangium canum TaxID=324952 RepID=UPI0037942F13
MAKPERIAIADAAARFRKPEATVRVWASRRRARKLLKAARPPGTAGATWQ